MQRLTINIPNNKTDLVKQILKGLGVNIEKETMTSTSDYRAKLKKVSVWSENDLKGFEEGKNAFDSLQPQQW
ncbi:hypothetical protein [Pedobacter helvus]|uniref:Uncharacterized protein n=1 Tax=Pedobacter helvus TaxID=2563444 RepID=A0ABW9JKX4_9SPHI|nr:hypothetical protein [Pedobacter ureilyticus]